MSLKSILAATAALLLASGSALAGAIPYPDAGQLNTAVYSFSAASTGELVVYFYAQSAGNSETIGVRVNGSDWPNTGLENHSSSYGESFDFGHVTAGDSVVFFIDEGGAKFYSDASLNSDGVQHAYATSWAGDGTIPAGTYVGFEDLAGGGDRDYNDTEFVFSNVVPTSTIPEPADVALLLCGLSMLTVVARRGRD